LVDEFKGFGQVAGAAAERGECADKGGKKLGPLVKQRESAIGIEFSENHGQLIAGGENGVVLEVVEIEGATGAFESLRQSEAGFGLLLLLEPRGETAVFPVGNVGGADAGVAPGSEAMGDIGIRAARAKHLVDLIANLRRERSDFSVSRPGRSGV